MMTKMPTTQTNNMPKNSLTLQNIRARSNAQRKDSPSNCRTTTR